VYAPAWALYCGPLRRRFIGWGLSTSVADDLTQDTFVRAMETWDAFNGKDSGDLQAWIFKLATYEHHHWHTVRAREARNLTSYATFRAPNDAGGGRMPPDQAAALAALQGWLATLPQRDRMVLELGFFEEIPSHAIAADIETALGTRMTAANVRKRKQLLLEEAARRLGAFAAPAADRLQPGPAFSASTRRGRPVDEPSQK
jgi:RNA polymerase sigma factor (sigma-70 family)